MGSIGLVGFPIVQLVPRVTVAPVSSPSLELTASPGSTVTERPAERERAGDPGRSDHGRRNDYVDAFGRRIANDGTVDGHDRIARAAVTALLVGERDRL